MFSPKSEHTKFFISQHLAMMQDFLELLKNPSQLAELIKQANALSESEQKRVASSVEYVSKAKHLQDDISNREVTVANKTKLADEKLNEARGLQEAAKALQTKLEKTKNAQEQKDNEHKQKDAVHATEQASLDKLRLEVEKREASVRAKTQENEQLADKLRKRAELLRAGAEGL